MKIKTVEISFPVEVELPLDFEEELNKIVYGVCELYKSKNPSRTMWPFGRGAKPIWNEPHEPSFDDATYCVEVAERAKLPVKPEAESEAADGASK